MNFSKFFVDRPIFAGVLSTLILLIGIISIWRLPISEYPEVVPPSVVVRAQFPGANPKVIAETVSAPLEEQINGVENMLYMSSQATTDGVMTLTITFKIGTNVEQAETQVQNRVQRALPRLPEEVRQIGVTTVKSSSNITMVVHLVSPKSTYDEVYLRSEVRKAREQGYSAKTDGLLEGMAGIAVPVFDRNGNVVAALSVGTLVNRLSADRLPIVVDMLLREANRLTTQINPFDPTLRRPMHSMAVSDAYRAI